MIIKKNVVHESILSSIQEYFLYWKSLNAKPDISRNEQLLSSFIAHNLRNIENKYSFVSHETNYATIEASMRSTRLLNPLEELSAHRYDLVLWSRKKSETMEPYSVIESKISLRDKTIFRDAKKLVDLFKYAHTTNNGTIKNGYLAFTSLKRTSSSEVEDKFHAVLEYQKLQFSNTDIKVAGKYNPDFPNAGLIRLSINRN